MIRLLAAVLLIFAALPARAEPKTDTEGFIAHEVLKAVVGLRIEVPMEAHTARTLGYEREGTGVVISSDGLVLTVGYLILEAETIDILVGTEDEHVTIPGRAVAYDHDSGFGLVRAAKPLGVQPVQFGSSDALGTDSHGLVVSFGGYRKLTPIRVTDRRPFAGYWEFMTERAIFTMPPHIHFGGAVLFDKDGYLAGIGSIFVNDAIERDSPAPGNMFLPIDTLKPILGQLVAAGKRQDPPNPWLGLNLSEMGGRLVVTRVRQDGPAYAAGLQRGDIVMGVEGRRVTTLPDYFKKVWAKGRAGVTVTLDVLKQETADLGIEQVQVDSVDRAAWLNPPE